MECKFEGAYTAIITPFNSAGEIDWECFDKLVEYQIEQGVSGIVPCGTTGEAPTLTEKEELEVIARSIKLARNRVSVIPGTGFNCTRKSIEHSRQAEELGADAVMLVNPYYNKPTQEGLFRHFSSIAKSIGIPVLLYNIKGRTSVNVETETLLRLIDSSPNIKAVKEASGDIAQISDVVKRTPESFRVLSGDDNMTFRLMRAGGHGVVSVLSNLVPNEVVNFVNAALRGDWKQAEIINQELMPLFEAMFYETNPIPIKTAVAMQGRCLEIFRLPMCELSQENRSRLEVLLRDRRLI